MKRVSGDVLGSLGDHPGTRRSLEVGIRILRAWEGALGESLARVLRPGLLSEGCLRVQVASSAWLMEARFLEPRLLRALRKSLPDLEIRSIEFELAPREAGDKAPRRSGQPAGRRRKDLEESRREEIQALVREVRDPELREGLARFFGQLATRGHRGDEERNG